MKKQEKARGSNWKKEDVKGYRAEERDIRAA